MPRSSRPQDRTGAQNAYLARRLVLQDKMLRLENMLEAHAQDAAKNPHNWSYAGDLDKVLSLMDQAAQALGRAGADS